MFDFESSNFYTLNIFYSKQKNTMNTTKKIEQNHL